MKKASNFLFVTGATTFAIGSALCFASSAKCVPFLAFGSLAFAIAAITEATYKNK